MPNQRAKDTVVTSFAVLQSELTAARERAAREGTKVSAVLREALRQYGSEDR